jgi:hypothetical protein
MSLTREQILNISDIEVKQIHVPEWNSDIHIRQLTRGQQDAYLKRQFGKGQTKKLGSADAEVVSEMNLYGHDAFLCVCGVCDAAGNPLFKPEDEKSLQSKSGKVIGFIASEIVEFSGMAGDVEELDELKN